MRSTTKLLATASATGCAVLLAAGPAIARPRPPPIVAWHVVEETTGNWKCGAVVDHPAADGLRMRACVVRNSGGDRQAVLILVNHTGRQVQIHGETNTYIKTNLGGRVRCASSPLQNGFQVGCFSKTQKAKHVSDAHVWMTLNVNGYVKKIEYTLTD
ncbi:hypothetical protein ACFWU3_35445 [Streptomyces sp. NPDC058685]|uniref:hypothetical protein n=1 Tax=Streptomyces sp. NPDC058685 TaxID=3346598 RepID=UPI00365B9685